MDEMILRIFQVEVERQCKFALNAFQDIREALERHDTDRIWYSVQSFLIAVGNISKLLWPGRRKKTEYKIPNRGKRLRASLLVKDGSPLKSRMFRNHFEHFDERIEKWAGTSRQRNFIDANIGPRRMFGSFDSKDYMRHFDPTDFSVTFLGDEYPLIPVYKAVRELYEKAIVEANKW